MLKISLSGTVIIFMNAASVPVLIVSGASIVSCDTSALFFSLPADIFCS